ncbi:3-isopropylmalate dehydrogenase [Flavobacterium muglaense]|uniref:3-isopropylmalate dehydrogenase n=1 Tax=Flavobacterium muglaense TaxID=2764716 RepID=A0A923MZJ9_9FLAO|nr:3-isopropylmalate dehydrogenase [Flavobacterium muglaense]MBC5838730.1 3-isopropylmalate dehydrogenase [Flavobacterium muglaense]MBC5845238.1 3-isopropylmalate dehydrogenase [Flavobacterium muglaense]
MKKLKIAVLAGDGIGPEVILQAQKALAAVALVFGHEFTFEDALIGAVAIERTGKPLPDQTLNLCKNTDSILFGAIGDPIYDNNPESKIRPEQGLLKLRKELGLYANIRPIKAYPKLMDASPIKKEILQGTDFVIYRELNGGMYFGEKHLNEAGTYASDLCEYNEDEIAKITHLAFKAAQERRKKVTLVDKANVLETSRLWRKVVQIIAKDYPDVTLEFLYVDNAAMQLILNPRQFDVLLTDNLFGDILSDEASVIAGSKGLMSSASVGEKYSLFEPIHGSYSEVKGKNCANPIASILSAAMLLEHFGLSIESKAIIEAVEKAIINQIVTIDLKVDSKIGTNEVGDYIANYILNKGDLYFKLDNVNLGQSTIV